MLIDGDLVLSDLSVICQYVEDKQPEPSLFPADIRDRARARWLEEFADTRMGDVFIWRLFNQIAIRPSVWGEKGDRELVDRTLKEDVPAVLDYLERGAGRRFPLRADLVDRRYRPGVLLPQRRLGEGPDRRGALATRSRLDGAHACLAAVQDPCEDRGRNPAHADPGTAQRAGSPGRADRQRDVRNRFAAPRHHADMSPCGGYRPSSTAASSAA